MIKIVTDSTTSLSLEECKKLDLICLETTYMLNDQLFSAFENESESLDSFYDSLLTMKSCSTGCVNVDVFEKCFEEIIKEGNEVFYIGLSASLSSTFNNSKLASENLNKKYGKKLVAVVDSRSASYGTLCLIERAKELISDNKSISDIETEIDKLAKNMTVSFVPSNINFIYKSGRLNIIEASIGKLFKIIPIISVSESGKLKVTEKSLGFKNAIKTLKNKYVKIINSKGYTKCYFSTTGLIDECENLRDMIASETNLKVEDMKIGSIDKTLACCCGPKTIAIFCM